MSHVVTCVLHKNHGACRTFAKLLACQHLAAWHTSRRRKTCVNSWRKIQNEHEWIVDSRYLSDFKCWFTLIQALLKVVDKVTKTWTWDRAAIARAWLHHASCHHCKFALMSEQNLERPAIRCRWVSVSYVSLLMQLMQLMLSVGPESRCRLSYIDSTASLRLWHTSKRSLAFSCFFSSSLYGVDLWRRKKQFVHLFWLLVCIFKRSEGYDEIFNR